MWLILLLVVVSSCNGNKEKTIDDVINSEDYQDSLEALKRKNERKELITIKYGEYKEYYPGKEKIKIRGFVNDDEQRTGKWSFYDQQGNELSVIMYENGKREGFSVVRYPNGSVRYSGEYHEDKKVGEWKFYDEQGNLTVKHF